MGATPNSEGFMDIKKSIKSQYHASMMMLRQAAEKCPEALWANDYFVNPFWHVAYHVLYFTHLYLQPREEDFATWNDEPDELHDLGKPVEESLIFNREQILAYLDFCMAQVGEQVNVMDLSAESGFYWLPFDMMELQFYNIRHVMLHTGELFERLCFADAGPS